MSAVLLGDLENTTNIKVYAILGKFGLPNDLLEINKSWLVFNPKVESIV